MSNILFTAGFASYAVNEVGTVSTDVFARVYSSGGGALELVLIQKEWTKLAFGVGADSFLLIFSPQICERGGDKRSFWPRSGQSGQ